MSRPIVLSNGELHVGLNNFGMVHDFYFPYVGFENHSAGSAPRHKIGVWIDGKLSWLDDAGQWTFDFRLPHEALIGVTIAKNEKMGVILQFDDLVDSDINAFIRNIHVINTLSEKREIRLFMHQAFVISDSASNTDTAQYLPNNNAILHYRGHKAFIISGMCQGKPFDQYSIGLFGIEGKAGTWCDADDGKLDCNNVEHGRVDSTLLFKLLIDPHSSGRVHYWIAVGKSIRNALAVHKQILSEGVDERVNITAVWWRNWLKPTLSIQPKIPEQHRKNFLQSMMIIKSQIDNHGAIIASTDTSLLNYSRDAYGYCWPRDGAYTLWPLIRMGYTEEAYRFFSFIKHWIHSDGYLMHKYRADGALGSSWHPYIHGDIVSPPIQEDETALPVFIFAQFYLLNPDPKLLDEFYQDMIVPMADFMTDFVDKTNGLPKPSYDLWEQTFLTSTYTTAVTYAALIAASDLATATKDSDNAVKWRAAATGIQEAAHKYLYNDTKQVFFCGLNADRVQTTMNDVVDCSSVFGAYNFGLFDASSPQITSSIETIKRLFKIDEGAPGLPRYENDEYRRTSRNICGNYWFITSFWLAQYYIDHDQRDKAEAILDWARNNSMSTGVMGEQFNPVDNIIVAPAPLTWTHAEYIATLLDLISTKEKS